MLDEILLDLCIAFALRQHRADQIPPLATGFRWTNIKRCTFTRGTIQLLGDAVHIIVSGSWSLRRDRKNPKPCEHEGEQYKVKSSPRGFHYCFLNLPTTY